jgi:hypothetical protein
LTNSSLTLQPNLFQLFHPIGGVSAKPLSKALEQGEPISAPQTIARNKPARFTNLDMATTSFSELKPERIAASRRGQFY